MNISVGHIDALQPTTPLLAFGAWEGAPLPEAQASLIETDDWAGSFKQTLLIDPRGAGDLLKTLSELTIQVINTGAEGRIVLADALFYAQRFAPAALWHVVGSYPWVDMDIAGTVWADTRTRAHIPKGATGVGVRLLTQRLQTWAEAHR